ncbi:hypothetical protein LCGC14_1394180 [marine sediment metagenome]|uniref:Uncharacterized protein n=1 Tax=marine sediment metagenome TaxID=412755 RepID=A0A0F9JZ18_9ZZZZ
MKKLPNGQPVSHLGDGVYAIHDGFGIWLHANDHENPTDKIYIEPEVLEALLRFNNTVKAEMKEKKDANKTIPKNSASAEATDP